MMQDFETIKEWLEKLLTEKDLYFIGTAFLKGLKN